MSLEHYQTTLPAGGHWSFKMRRGTQMKLHNNRGVANAGMMFYNPENLLERYNAPDTLKCQHTFKLTKGHCLYSDMGRIFASIIDDTFGWHDTVCGNSNAAMVAQRWGGRDYQNNRNQWHQNGHDAFLVELTKYGLSQADLGTNINWFSKVVPEANGQLHLAKSTSPAPSSVTLRFEMDTLVILHACPHPLNQEDVYPNASIDIDLSIAEPVLEDDVCKNSCPENQRGFMNNALYFFGS